MSKRRHSKTTGQKLASFNLSLSPELMAKLSAVGAELGLSRSALLTIGAEYLLANLDDCPKCGKLIGCAWEMYMASAVDDTVVCDHCGEVIG